MVVFSTMACTKIVEVEVSSEDYSTLSDVNLYFDGKAKARLLFTINMNYLSQLANIERQNPDKDFSDLLTKWQEGASTLMVKAAVDMTRAEQALEAGAYSTASSFMTEVVVNLEIVEENLKEILQEMHTRISPLTPTPKFEGGTSA